MLHRATTLNCAGLLLVLSFERLGPRHVPVPSLFVYSARVRRHSGKSTKSCQLQKQFQASMHKQYTAHALRLQRPLSSKATSGFVSLRRAHRQCPPTQARRPGHGPGPDQVDYERLAVCALISERGGRNPRRPSRARSCLEEVDIGGPALRSIAFGRGTSRRRRRQASPTGSSRPAAATSPIGRSASTCAPRS